MSTYNVAPNKTHRHDGELALLPALLEEVLQVAHKLLLFDPPVNNDANLFCFYILDYI
jgi:hypothetical protein